MSKNNKSKTRNNQSKVTKTTSQGNIVKAPVAKARSSMRLKPGTIRVTESERIGTISGSTTLAITSIDINPGLSSAFPWLNQLANIYDEYKFHKLKFRYKPIVSTSNGGNIIMAFDYDVLDTAPTTAIQLTQMSTYKDSVVWNGFELPIDVSRIVKKYTRSGTVSGADQKTYDAGKLYMAAESCANTSTQGYLEVDYDIEFYNKSPVGLNA